MIRISIVALLVACSAPPADMPLDHTCAASDSFLCGRIRNIAHRGGAALAPENTLPAFANAVSIGADILEMDVRRTSDGVVILLHDPMVDRTTDGTGAVSGMTYAQLQQLDAGYKFTRDSGATRPYRGIGVRVPTLADVLAAHPDRYFMNRDQGQRTHRRTGARSPGLVGAPRSRHHCLSVRRSPRRGTHARARRADVDECRRDGRV
jgi:hypothetical protein